MFNMNKIQFMFKKPFFKNFIEFLKTGNHSPKSKQRILILYILRVHFIGKNQNNTEKQQWNHVMNWNKVNLINFIFSEWQDRALCTKLYNLLIGEGQKLSLKVTAAIVTRITGKPVENLLAYEIALSLDKKHHPKSGWGNPVCEKDTGTGDDIERLNWIQIFIREKSNTVTVSVEKYMELINIMAEALNRLDPDAEFNEDYKALFNKLTSIEIPLTETVVSKVSE